MTTIADVRGRRRSMAGEVAVVMTMGALHEGHLDLVRAARTAADHVIVTIFVNPTQFGSEADLAAYPRTLAADVAALASLGEASPDLVFAPSGEQMYPTPGVVTVSAGEMGERLEGASRPGHFDGVLTVVTKLLGITQPDVAVFGEKDAQQLALVRRLVADLDLPTWILSVPVARDRDGLALSSRNVRLSDRGRAQALALSRSVALAQRYARAGASAAEVQAAARDEVTGAPGITLDYALLVDPTTFLPLVPDGHDARIPAPAEAHDAQQGSESISQDAVYVVAAVVEGVRLLDTGALRIEPGRALGSMPG
nr:pantoate--beta-alanine ligase [Serinibacter salmoneus]